jgi:hypothetical protein
MIVPLALAPLAAVLLVRLFMIQDADRGRISRPHSNGDG